MKVLHRVGSLVLSGLLIATSAPSIAAAAPSKKSGSTKKASNKDAPSKDDEKKALELFTEGRKKFDQEDFEGAIADFEAAYELLDERNLLYNIAQAYARMEQYDRAIEVLDRYRLRAPESEYDQIDAQQKEWAEKMDPPEPEPEVKPEKLPPPEAGTETEPVTTKEDTGGDPEGKVFGVGPGVLTAVAIAALGSGLGLGLASRAAKNRALGMCVDDAGALRCRDTFDAQAEDNRRLALGANIAFAVGGAAALATVIWVSVNASRRSKARKAKAALAPTVDRTQAGLAISGRF